MKSIFEKIITPCIGILILLTTTTASAEIKFSIEHGSWPHAALSLSGKEAMQLWKYFLELQKDGAPVTDEAEMNKHYLQIDNSYCYKVNPAVYGDRKRSDDDPELYDCSLQLFSKNLLIQEIINKVKNK